MKFYPFSLSLSSLAHSKSHTLTPSLSLRTHCLSSCFSLFSLEVAMTTAAGLSSDDGSWSLRQHQQILLVIGELWQRWLVIEVVIALMLSVSGIVDKFGREMFGKNPILTAKPGLDGPLSIEYLLCRLSPSSLSTSMEGNSIFHQAISGSTLP